MIKLPAWVNNLLEEPTVQRCQVYYRRKGRPPKGAIELPVPLLCAVDAGQTTGVALIARAWGVVLEAKDEYFVFAKALFRRLPTQATVCIESGFCPSAEAVFRAGVYAGLAHAKDFTPALIHPNAKAKVYKQSPPAEKRSVIAHSFNTFNFAYGGTDGEGHFEHACDAVGIAFAYLRNTYNLQIPNFRLSFNFDW
jgi:hypothetical protein